MVNFVSTIHTLRHLKIKYLEVPKTIVDKLGGFSKQRFLCTADKKVSWQCGLVALKDGAAYINLNKKILTELEKTEGDQVKVSLTKDKSEYGLEMPIELKTLLKQDTEGMRRFKLLVAGKQRYIIYYVSQVKDRQLRIDRAVRLITNLKSSKEGKESFKAILAK